MEAMASWTSLVHWGIQDKVNFSFYSFSPVHKVILVVLACVGLTEEHVGDIKLFFLFSQCVFSHLCVSKCCNLLLGFFSSHSKVFFLYIGDH
jgi:hypothetical protein